MELFGIFRFQDEDRSGIYVDSVSDIYGWSEHRTLFGNWQAIVQRIILGK